ncbi:MAG: hypothetical protein ABJB66_03425 [Gemmatimonadaceae bacterium]
MKRTLQVISAALLLTVASVTAQAQGGGGGGGRGMAMQKENMMKEITVTPAISAQIDTLMQTANTKRMALGIARGTPPTEEQSKQSAAIMSDRNAAIKKLLTADQQTQFDKNMAAMAAMGRGRGGL